MYEHDSRSGGPLMRRPPFTGYRLRCEGCDSYIRVGFDRLEAGPAIECYVCGEDIEVADAPNLARVGRALEATLQPVLDAMNAAPLFTDFLVRGSVVLTKNDR